MELQFIFLQESCVYCNQCGKQNPDDARICAYCGAPVPGAAQERRLVRPRAGRRIAGVCAGLADYYGWNLTAMRVIWLVLFLFGGTGGLLYLILWIVMPNAD